MNIKELIKELKGFKKHFPDLLIKEIKISIFKSVYIVTTESVASGDKTNDFVLKYFGDKRVFDDFVFSNLKKDIESYIPSINMTTEVKTKKDFYYYLYNGYTLVLAPDEDVILGFETRAEIDRGVTEATSEPRINGPKDSFTENYNINIGLVRKRIKSTSLWIDEVTVGKETKSKVSIVYMENIVEDGLVDEIKKKLGSIDIDGVLEVGYFKDLIRKENHTVFPTIAITEKPEHASKQLLDGKVIIMMENSPNALIVPTLLIDYFQNAEDYTHKNYYASFLRILRIFAFLVAIILPAFYIAITTYDQGMIPTSLLINFAIQREGVPFPGIIEALLLLVAFEILNEGDSRIPSARSTSLSILGALILGEAAVSAGLISPIMVIVVAITAICTLLFLNSDLQGPIRFWRYLFMFFTSIFGIVGLISAISLMLINLCAIKSFGKPYLLPFAPFFKRDSEDMVIKRSMLKANKRKSYLTKKNLTRGRNK